MSKMITVASGFQYSVNIGYDLNNEDKIKNFIPTSSALRLLEDILLSTQTSSTERSRILIGAYGKGKSHIMLMILSVLLKKKISLIEKVLLKSEGTKLHQNILNYYDSDNKILPVIITGSNTSLTQAFLLALQRTLSANELMDVMPETNYKAAISTIEKWKKDFPETYHEFEDKISVPVDTFIDNLNEFDIGSYEIFESVYPTLTAGSVFNPFLGFDVVELYENAAKGLKEKGYSGIYVIYDEFSKYLEANIAAASVSDTKMLQDFAEKCNRSGDLQMHLMLISHKEIANYIDVLPKQKTDGWRGVSERFLHVHLNNNFSQTYEIIESVIQKDSKRWTSFCKKHERKFESLLDRYVSHPIFQDMDDIEISKTISGCYPLQPVSTFILPRLSERVAQNERTLFTFLSANGISTLPAYLEEYGEDSFSLITPDRIYDYFEPLFKKEVYSGALHDNYRLTEIVLNQLDSNTLESKIVKTIALIYILEQFEKIKPTKEELFGIFSTEYTHKEIEEAIDTLIEKEYVIYLKRSNNYLQLKQSSGVDVQQKIADTMEIQRNSISVEEALNEVNIDNYLYPSRYNDAHEMMRYFSFAFISSKDLTDFDLLKNKLADVTSDGFVLGVLPESKEDIVWLKKILIKNSNSFEKTVFVLPRAYKAIEKSVREYHAIIHLKEEAKGDAILFDEYEVIYEDLRELISAYISGYTRPEQYQSYYIFKGKEYKIRRKAAFTGLLSDICDVAYSKTPIINNEALNRNEATSVSRNSRNKVVAALLRPKLEPQLGLTGTGQDISIMRSTLVRTGLLEDYLDNIKINLHPVNNELISGMIDVIEEFIFRVRDQGSLCFSELYKKLCSSNSKIALRKELVPIYLAVVLREYREDIVIADRFGQVPLSVDTIIQINASPDNYSLEYLDWNEEKSEFIQRLETFFEDTLKGVDKGNSPFEFIIVAMRQWYISLPKYSKDMTKTPDGKRIDKGYINYMKLLKQNSSGSAFLFEDIPQAFGYKEFVSSVADNIQAAKRFYDEAMFELRAYLCDQIKYLFTPHSKQKKIRQMSLTSVIRDWCESLDDSVFEQLFPDGTDKCLSIFKTISNDEDTFIARIAKATTDLRLEDWDYAMIEKSLKKLEEYKITAESFAKSDKRNNGITHNEDSYEVSFIEEDGSITVKRFDKVDTGRRAELLLNKITADLESFGQAVSESEKRQILMNVLKKLC